MKRLLLLAPFLLTACVPRAVPFSAANMPDPAALGPNNAVTEWWYVSGSLPDTQQAFHWAQFKVNYKGIPYFASHVVVTDLNTGKVTLLEESRQDAKFSFPPLKVTQGDWTLTQSANLPTAPFVLAAGPLQLTWTPQKGPVVHPPGYSGTPETGQLYYQSVTRLAVSGTINGQPAGGAAWFDHQWADQQPCRAALWDWFGLHLSDGSDLMLYLVKTVDGKVVQLAGSEVGTDGVARELKNVTMTPQRQWVAPSGRSYTLDWKVTSDLGDLTLRAVNDNQELLTKTTSVAYWEGPIQGYGTWGGAKVKVEGMGEFIGGILTEAEGGSFGAK